MQAITFKFCYGHVARLDQKQHVNKINYSKGGKPLFRAQTAYCNATEKFDLDTIVCLLNSLKENYILRRSKTNSGAPKRWKVLYSSKSILIKTFSVTLETRGDDHIFLVNIYSINQTMDLIISTSEIFIIANCPIMQYQNQNNILQSEVKRNKICTEFLQYYHRYVAHDNLENIIYANIYSNAVMKAKYKSQTKNLKEYLNSLPGYKKIILRDFLNYEDPKSVTYEGGLIKYVIWIDPAGGSIFQEFSYMEIDCSFRLFENFVYCIFHCIEANVSVPLGFIVGPSETTELYDTFYQTFLELFAIPHHCKLPVLADNGTAIESFISKNDLTKFDCHRHLIESCGSASPLGCLINRILKIPSEEEFESQRPVFKEQLKMTLKTDSLSKVDSAFHKVLAMLDCYYMSDVGQIGDLSEKTNKQRWALWLRNGVATASNHSEGTHGLINRQLKGKLNFQQSLEILFNTIKSRKDNFSLNREKNVKANVYRLYKMKETNDILDDQHCQCAFGNIMAQRLKIVNHLCVHTVTSKMNPQLIEVNSKWENTIEDQQVIVEKIPAQNSDKLNPFRKEIWKFSQNDEFLDEDLLDILVKNVSHFTKKKNPILRSFMDNESVENNEERNAIMEKLFFKILNDLKFLNVKTTHAAYSIARSMAALDSFNKDIDNESYAKIWMLSLKLGKLKTTDKFEETINIFLKKFND